MRDALSQSLLARGIRWRCAGSALIVITAAIAVGSAVVAPLFARAGGSSLVHTAVSAAPPNTRGFDLIADPTGRPSIARLDARDRSLLQDARIAHLFGHPTETLTSDLQLADRHGIPYRGQLTYRSGVCAHLSFIAGACEAGRDDAVISARTAGRLGLGTGSVLSVPMAPRHGQARIRITGVFRIPDLRRAYWFNDGNTFFRFGQVINGLTEVDDVFLASRAMYSSPLLHKTSADIESPLRSVGVNLQSAAGVRHDMLTLVRQAADHGLSVDTGLPALLSRSLHQQSLMDTIVAVAAIQLVLLAIWVLTSVLLHSADLRRSELRVARLRGFPPRTLFAVSITEPAALCAIGTVLGIAAAWAVVLVAGSSLFASATVVRPDTWTFLGFGAVVVTISAVLGLTTMRLLRNSGLVAGSSAAISGRTRAVVDVSILAVAVVALVGASTSGALDSHSNPVAAAAPAVVALGVSVIAIRIVGYLCRRLSSATLDSPAVASFLAVRRVGRRPTVLREGRTLVIAVGLACFAVSAWSVARANRTIAARFSIGARTVVTVTPAGRQLDQAVDVVDPRGRFAMAAVQVSTSSTTLTAVDAPRLPAVAAWPRGTTNESVTAVSRALTPRPVTEVTTTDGALAVSATVPSARTSSRDLAHADLSAWLFDPAHGTRIVDLGRLRPGRSAYRAARQSGCPCRLIGIGVLPGTGPLPRSGRIQLGVNALSAGASQAPRATLAAAAWHPTTDGVRVLARGPEVSFDIPMSAVSDDAGRYENESDPMASLPRGPAVPPATVGSRAESLAAGTLAEQGLDGNSIAVRPVVTANSLPRTGRGGVLVDLDALRRIQVRPTTPDTTDEVWLGPRAPADAVHRLRAAGLDIGRVQRASTLVSHARHTGPALAYDFMLLATLIALLVAAVGTFSVLAAGGRQRATEMVALEVAGVRRSILVRSLGIEASILALTALFGVAAGAGSAAIALPSLPQLAGRSDAPLSDALPIALILAVAAAAVLVVGLAAGLAARGILSSMSPSLLRAPDDDVD